MATKISRCGKNWGEAECPIWAALRMMCIFHAI
jgi:hypothetical protein